MGASLSDITSGKRSKAFETQRQQQQLLQQQNCEQTCLFRVLSCFQSQNYGCFICQSQYREFTACGGDQSVAALVALPKCFLQNFAADIVNAFSRGGNHSALARQRFMHKDRLARTTVDRIESLHASSRRRTVSRSTQTHMQLLDGRQCGVLGGKSPRAAPDRVLGQDHSWDDAANYADAA